MLQPKYETTVVVGTCQLRRCAAAWDRLWERSDVTSPTARAELVAQWAEQFAEPETLRAIVVVQGERFVGALPLVERNIGRVVDAAGLPANHWAPAGALLLDPAANMKQTCEQMVAAISKLPHQLLWLDEIRIDSPPWQAMCEALARCKTPFEPQSRFQVAFISTREEWETCRQRWSRNFRRRIARQIRRLERLGQLRFRLESPGGQGEIAALLRRGFEVEDAGWKGRVGSSVLQTPGMFPFYLRQSQQLAEWGNLRVALLELDGQLIAFEYAWKAKQVYHSFKVAYDEQHRAFSPGQVLLHFLFEHFCHDPDTRGVDCMGPVSEAVAHWRPESYSIGRLVVAPGGFLGRSVLYGYRHLWPFVRRLRNASIVACD